MRGIQVDEGSEFMAEFEHACRDKGLELCVLPPKRPDLNGCVERAQSTWRYEFYAAYDLHRQVAALRRRLRPPLQPLQTHQALGDITPAEYLKTLSQQDPSPSHMS